MKRLLFFVILLGGIANLSAQNKPEVPGKKFPQFISVDQNVSKGQSLNLLRQYFELATGDEMRLQSAKQDELGFEHDTYQQYYKGIKVDHGIYTIHSKAGSVRSLSGNFVDINNLNVTASLQAPSALARALTHVKATVYAWDARVKNGYPDYEKPKGELVITSDDEKRIEPTLAYKFDIYAAEPLYRAYVFIDAKTGAFIKEEQLIHEGNVAATANTRYNGTQNITADYTGTNYRLRQAASATVGGSETYSLNNGTNYGSAVDVTSTSNSFTADITANAAHWAADKTYTYYKSIHGRNSYNNAGGVIKSYVHYSRNYVNAFWDGTRMTYGDGDATYGPLVSIDICGHEISHGVTQYSANLTYSNESGALNESFSDIFGESIENFAKGSNDWLMSQDIGAPFRSMSNPNAYGDPDTYKGTNWYSGTSDNGGVHTNSGVQNKWFYILSAGESGTNDFGSAYNVTGLGIVKAAKIAYRNLTVYLSASSGYGAARAGAIQAAIDLYGAGSAEVIATTNAWYAVGVGCAYGTSCYCISAGNNFSYEWIKTVSIASFTNNSGAAGYSNFTNLSLSLAAGSTNAVTLTPGFASATYNEYWKIWIDFNGDGDFDDAGEQVFGAGLSNTAVTGTITIPASASGAKRMRVSMKYNAQQTACETFAYGEVEDYTATFTSAGDNQPPTAPVLSSPGATQTSIDLSWTAATDNVGVTGYDVYVDGALNGSTTTATTYTINGLVSGSTHSLYVKAKDAAGNSTNSNTISVTTQTAPDNTPPSAPVLSVAGSTSNSISLSWTTATDNVAVTGYDVYVDGALNGSTTSATTYVVNSLTPSTTYSLFVKAKDAAGNSTASNTITETTQAMSTTTTLSAHYFETGWDGWVDGGGDCSRYNGSRSYEGLYSILIRDNSGMQSAMTSPVYNVTAYNQLTVDFYFYSAGMSNGHDFWVRYFDGSSWSTVAAFVAGTDFNNNGFYHATVTLGAVNFPANAQFRFQCDANTNNNQIYIDAVKIIAGSGATISSVNNKSITLVSQQETGDNGTQEGLLANSSNLVKVYPNPAVNEVSIDLKQPVKSIKLYSVDGRLVKMFRGFTRDNKINVSSLKTGIYLMIIETNEGKFSRKFIKQ